jgi:hypothetical protein
MDLSDRRGLGAIYKNIDAALPERVAVAKGGRRFHRPDDSGDGVVPACGTSGRGHGLVDPRRARAVGITPCRNCYEAVFEYLARQPDSPVESRGGGAEPDPDAVGEVEVEAIADGGGDAVARPTAPLTARTETVRIKAGASKIYHAPAADGTLCGEEGSGYRSVPYASVDGHYRPCERCFDL